MRWKNLNLGKCPKEECEELLEGSAKLVKCTFCDFSMRKEKYNDLIKGKASAAYKNVLQRAKRAKFYKDKMKKAIEANIAERISTLNRMLAQGKITQEEYTTKIHGHK